MKRMLVFLLSNVLFNLNICTQEVLHQNIRGKVVDITTQQPLIGVTITLLNTDPIMGTITNINGEFILMDVDVGRHDIHISYVGYEPISLNNMLLTSAKELFIFFELEEMVTELEEVVVKAGTPKSKTLNQMASVSARQFTVEETEKFAGSFGDISRMVVNYAGVTAISNQRNDIIIRGNNPMGLLWRIEDIDIPNPNHFGEAGSTGGAITIVNNNVLRNSDFLTGAFPAEYGNALAGAFDLKLRNGNIKKREYTFQAGYNGIEFGVEGPFSSNSHASYLMNYRLSTLQAVHLLGFELGVVPEYQDIAFKNHVPLKKGSISVFGIGGISKINIKETEKDVVEWTYEYSAQDVLTGSDMGVIGANYQYFINEKTRVNTNLAICGEKKSLEIDSMHIDNKNIRTIKNEELSEIKYYLSTSFIRKFNRKNSIETGVIFEHYRSIYDFQKSYDGGESLTSLIKTNKNFNLYRPYSQFQHKFSNNLSSTLGLHYQYFEFNNKDILEPRFGTKWEISKRSTVNIGLGLHSQLQPRFLYAVETINPDSTRSLTNRNLDFTKSIHYVIGYDFFITSSLRLKVEGYYQNIYDVPVKEGLPYFSMLNAGSNYTIEREDSLLNIGTGKNYGIEITFEKFFDNKFYFLVTLTLYESKYKGYNKIEKNSAYNGNFTINLLGGYEFDVGKNNKLAFDILTLWAGGRRYVPFIVYDTPNYHYVYDWENAYKKRHKDYFTLNLRISFILNRPKYNLHWSMDLQNITNNQNIFMQRFDPTTGEVKNEYQLGFIPVGKVRIEF